MRAYVIRYSDICSIQKKEIYTLKIKDHDNKKTNRTIEK